MAGEDFALQRLHGGVELYTYPADRFKTTRVDFFLSTPLQKGQNTRLALIGRLLERGTRNLPGLQHLNQFLDDLYGAGFFVEVEALGDHQVLHLGLEVIASPFLPGGEDLLARGIRFLGEVLADPEQEGEGFKRSYLSQEKKGLATYIRSLANDKTAYAHRRCLEVMCPDDPCAMPAYGDPRDFRAISARSLMSSHRQILAHSRIALFFSGHIASAALAELGHQLICWQRDPAPVVGPRVLPAFSGEVAEVFESHDVAQARLVLGYWTGMTPADADYPALVVFNALLGGDAQSRLFRHLREGAGLCYQIGSHLEPLCGLLFVEAGIEPEDYPKVRAQIEHQFQVLRQGVLVHGELELARLQLRRQLQVMDESCEGLVRFYYQQLLAGIWAGRAVWEERFEAVDPLALARVAAKVQLHTAFFLFPAQGSWRP